MTHLAGILLTVLIAAVPLGIIAALLAGETHPDCPSTPRFAWLRNLFRDPFTARTTPWEYRYHWDLDRYIAIRRCQACGEIQALDIDGWCNFQEPEGAARAWTNSVLKPPPQAKVGWKDYEGMFSFLF